MNSNIDFAYVRATHGFASDQEAAAWFAAPSLRDLRTFSPDFSPVDYLLMYPDVREAGANPIQHYLVSGAKEGRAIKPAPMLRQYSGAAAATRTLPSVDVRVAIVLHIYYPSFIPYFLERVRSLDLPNWSLFISAPEDLVTKFGPDLELVLGGQLKALRAVPNRGRNFAPFLVEFADELADYDVICHCHSKQSLHSGRAQTEWADYLVNALLGAPDVVRRHVNLIASGECDLISPAPYFGVPPWASHSLSNDAHLRSLCERLGISPVSGFMAYPVGGMFWMSRAVYREVLRLKLTIDDFPPEPSRPDGEVHHALERLVGYVAGPRQAFYDQVTASYWAADAVLRAEARRFAKLDEIFETIKHHDLVTFDFFDTLAVRSTSDEEWAKRRVEFALGQDYASRRNASEHKLRYQLGGAGDVPLSLIAAELAGAGFVDATRAVALERALDLATLVPRPDIVAAYEYAIRHRKHVLIVSDSYYDQGLIRSFLDKHGITHPADVFTSADLGMRKDRGDLWAHLARIRGRRSAVHLGDNVHSDIQKASEHGFQTFYVPHWRHELLPFSGFSKKLLARSHANAAFARSTDPLSTEQIDDELLERNLDDKPRRLSKSRRSAEDRSAR